MEKLFVFIKRSFGHELISGSMYVFAGTTVGSFLAFILNIYFARNLSYADYGVLASLLSIFSLAIIPAQSLGTIITNFGTSFIHSNEHSKASALYKKMFIYITAFIIGAIVVSILISGSLSKFLKIEDSTLVVYMLIIVSINYLVTLNISFLNSLLKFRYLSFTYIISGTTKFLLGVLLVALGWKVYGALGGILAMVLTQFFVSLPPLKKIINIKSAETKLPIKEIIAFAIPTTIAIFSLFSFVSSDVLLVKHFFNADQAGLYGGLSLIGRVIFYFTLPIPAVMFPLLVKRHTNKENYTGLFNLAILLVLVPSVLISIFYFLFPEFTIKIFLGGREYLNVAKYLGLFGIFLTIYSVNNVFITFFLSLKKMISSFIVLFFATLQIALIYLFHGDFLEIIYVSIFTSVLLLVFLLLYYLKENTLKLPANSS